MQLIDFCRDHTVEEILTLPDVKERVGLYFEQEETFKEQIRRCSTVHGNLVVLDLRNEETIYAGNRFMIYALYPDCNISIHVLWGLNSSTPCSPWAGRSSSGPSKTNIGELMLAYAGGGHEKAGTCQVENDDSERVLGELIEKITADG